MFHPSRLRIARKRRRLNKTRLAELIGVDLRTITGYERGEYEPAPDTLAQIVRILRFPASFFAGDELHEPSPATASFRSMSRMSASNREAALAAGAIAFLLNDWIEKRFDLPSPDLPDLREEDPETAAITLRQQWGLGERPVKNMIHLLESRGVRVFSMAEDTAEVDAFSLWRDTTPFVFLNTLKSAERGRFDAAHELGHLILHRHAGLQGKEVERDADRFASAFLMPRASVLAHAPVLPTLENLVRLKQLWIVSVASLTYRLSTLNILSEWHARSLFIEMGQRGYRTNEPQPAQREMSQILSKIFTALREEDITKEDVANQLYIEAEELDKLVFGLMLISLRGGKKSNSIKTTKPTLTLVKK